MGTYNPACAEEAPRFLLDLPAESLCAALRDLAAATHRNIIAASRDTEGKVAPPLTGNYTLAEAVKQLLAGSGLRAEMVGDGYLIRPGPAGTNGSSDIVVTGTRISGAPLASQLISITNRTMEDNGYSDLGSVVRAIPQSFGGGQNPGVGFNVPANNGGDVGGGSSVDLRGLGSDATLTLLDGHRVSYTAAVQSVDVSAIPLAIVDHIDIVADGASALYGSDAVAGVANIVLRPDMTGIETSARIGSATDGGDFQQQYSIAGGDRWSNGGFIAAYEYGSSTAIMGSQRSYAQNVAPDLTLTPQLRHDSVAFNGHQDLVSNLTLEMDAYYNTRRELSLFPEYSGVSLGSGSLETGDRVYGLAPSLKLRLGSDWRLSLAGTVGQERVDLTDGLCVGSACTTTSKGFYRNTAHSVELNGNGKLFDLPGGPLKLALGSGYRAISFVDYAGAGSSVNTQHAQNSYYAFGELAIPLVGPAQNIPLIESLNASAAVRYERYPGIANEATPKFGLVYAPDKDIDIKASWGKSFRVPTLYEQYKPRSVYLYPAAAVGALGQPASSAVLLILGGSPTLKPERATTWSAGFNLHPVAIAGAKLEVSYFNIRYRDRIVNPITTLAQALSNPKYADQITPSPDAASQTAAIASAMYYLNATAYPYSPANVLAIVDDASVNAGRQRVQGVDILAEYAAAFGARDHLNFALNATYLDSQQQLSASQPVTQLAGTIFNPPHWRGKTSLTWTRDDATLNLAGNYTGGVEDNRFTTLTRIGSMATMDLTARYTLHRLFGAIEAVGFTLAVQNLCNAKPTQIATSTLEDAPYDSTNYSPVGRLISFAISSKW